MGALSGLIQGGTAGAMTGNPYAALISGGVGLLGGMMGSDASNTAAEQAAQAQQQALQFAQQKYDQGRTDLAPYMATGTNANSQLGGLIAGMKQPGFDYQQTPFSFDKWSDPGALNLMQDATRAINASALAKGGVGGGLAKAVGTEVGNIGNQAYQGAFDRWLKNSAQGFEQAQSAYHRNADWQNNQIDQTRQTAQAGQGAAMGLAGMGQQMGQYGGNMIAGAGQSRAAGTLGANNAMTQGLQGAGGALADYLSQGSGTQLPKQKYGQTDWRGVYNNSSSNLLGDL